MFTGHFDFWMVQIGQKKICVNTMWRIVPFVESHSFKHHQKECLCPVNQMNNHREHAWLFSIFTTTTLPLGWPIRQGSRATIQFGMGNFYFMTILFCFSQVFWWPFINRSRQLKHGHNLHCIALWNLKYMFALYLKTKIKFDYGYVVLENLLFEFYAGLGTIKVIT